MLNTHTNTLAICAHARSLATSLPSTAPSPEVLLCLSLSISLAFPLHPLLSLLLSDYENLWPRCGGAENTLGCGSYTRLWLPVLWTSLPLADQDRCWETFRSFLGQFVFLFFSQDTVLCHGLYRLHCSYHCQSQVDSRYGCLVGTWFISLFWLDRPWESMIP